MTYYRINVTKKNQQGKIEHLFATADYSLRCAFAAQECWKIFKEKFPENEGYGLDIQYRDTYNGVRYWEHPGRTVNPETMEIE